MDESKDRPVRDTLVNYLLLGSVYRDRLMKCKRIAAAVGDAFEQALDTVDILATVTITREDLDLLPEDYFIECAKAVNEIHLKDGLVEPISIKESTIYRVEFKNGSCVQFILVDNYD